MRCLILGGAGFIGSHLVDALLAAGHHVRCFDRVDTHTRGARGSIEFFQGDFGSDSDVGRALGGCDICFHLVSTTLPQMSNDDPAYDVETNLLASVRMLRQAARSGLRKVIFVSSGGTVYGIPRETPIPEAHPTDPICSYGISKLAIEKYLALFHAQHGMDYAVLRLANPYGERQSPFSSQGVVSHFLFRAVRREPVEIWGDGSVVRDYVHIDDVMEAMLRVIEDTGSERIFNIGSGRGLSVLDVLDAIEATVGYEIVRTHAPRRAVDVPINILSIDRAARLLDWQPRTGFAEGLERYAGRMKADFAASTR